MSRTLRKTEDLPYLTDCVPYVLIKNTKQEDTKRLTCNTYPRKLSFGTVEEETRGGNCHLMQVHQKRSHHVYVPVFVIV